MYLLFLILSLCQICNALQIIHLTNDNFVALRGPVTSISVGETIMNLIEKTSDIRYIYLSTNGGSVTAGLKLINVIKDLENMNIEVNCIADTAISMGFVIFQSCTNRYVLSHSTLMQHQMSLSGVGGKLLEINSYMSHINTIEDELNQMQAARINMSQTEFENRISNDWWLTTNEAINLNVADTVVMIKCNFKNEKEIVIINSIFGEIMLVYMKCPQIASPIKVELKLNNDTVNNMNDVKDFVDNFINYKQKLNPIVLDRFIDIIRFA